MGLFKLLAVCNAARHLVGQVGPGPTHFRCRCAPAVRLRGKNGRGVRLITHLYLGPELESVDVHLYSPYTPA